MSFSIHNKLSLLLFCLFMFFGINALNAGNISKDQVAQAKKDTVVFLSINDPHAALKQFPRFGFMVDSLRQIYPDLLLVCGGDIQTGNPINDNYEPKGYPMIDLMNQLRFAYSAVGNHEFDATPKGFGLLTRLANFSFLSANMHPDKEFDVRVKPYAFHTFANGKKIAILGLIETSSNGFPATHPKNAVGVAFEDALSIAGNYKTLKDSADAVVALTHLGLETDKILVTQQPWIDFVIGGHSHTLIENGLTCNNIPITQSQNKLRYCALSFMVFDEQNKISVQTKTLEINNDHGEKNQYLAHMVDRFYDNPEYNKVVAIASAPFEEFQQLGYLMADSYLNETKSDFAFVNPGSVRINTLPAGEVKKVDILTLDPFGNAMVTRMMAPKEIRQFLQESWHIDSDLGPTLLGGLRVSACVDSKGNVSNVEILTDKGDKLDENKFYKVAYSSYIDSAYSFKHCQKEGQIHDYTTAESMLRFFETLMKEGKKLPDYRGVKREVITKK